MLGKKPAWQLAALLRLGNNKPADAVNQCKHFFVGGYQAMPIEDVPSRLYVAVPRLFHGPIHFSKGALDKFITQDGHVIAGAGCGSVHIDSSYR